jgi:ankyrin repeat protein
MSNQKQILNPLIKIYGPEKAKYDMVFIIGYNLSEEMTRITATAEKSGLYICIIGDGGKTSFLNKQLLAEAQEGKIDENTDISISAHGIAHRQDKPKHGNHYVSIYQAPPIIINNHEYNNIIETSQLLQDQKTIFDKATGNTGKKMNLSVLSCQAGAAQKHVPHDINTILHSGQKSLVISSMDADVIVASIEARKKSNICDSYKSFMDSMVLSPETKNYIENGISFKYSAPKQPLFGKELERFIIAEQIRFMEHRLDKLGHNSKDILGTDKKLSTNHALRKTILTKHIIANKEQFSITPYNLKRYNELALIIECWRNSKSAPFYIAKAASLTNVIADDNFIDINATLTNGTTPIRIAVEGGHLGVVKALINAKANVDLSDNNGTTPLYRAAYNGHLETVKALIDAKANVDLSNNNGTTPLYRAAQMGNLLMLNLLIEKGADINKGLYNTFTPLMVAALAGQKEAVELLLNKITNIENLTMPCSAEKAKQFCAQQLNKGIKIDIPPEHSDLFGKTAATMAATPEITELINKRIAELQPAKSLAPEILKTGRKNITPAIIAQQKANKGSQISH